MSLADDEAELRRYATELSDRLTMVIGPWVERCVERISTAYFGDDGPDLAEPAARAGRAAAADEGADLRRLLETDVERQRSNPLHLLRRAVRHPTSVLDDAGIPAVIRDPDKIRAFPDDTYDLVPATWDDVDPSLHEPGLAWSAAKAHVVLARRRRR